MRSPVLLLTVAALLMWGCSRSGPGSSDRVTPGAAADSVSGAGVVLHLGERLKRVSLLAPDSLVRVSIRAEYGDLVLPALLEEWLRNPSEAPGRLTSSPWPDRIEITSGSPEPGGPGSRRFVFTGNIVERTSATPEGGASGRIPIRVTTERLESAGRSRGSRMVIWSYRIAEFEQARRTEGPPAGGPDSTSGGASSPDPADSPERAADVIRDYYRAIADGRYRDAYQAWARGGAASGQTFEEFQAGFARTASVEASVGQPGRMEGAAGSRYIEVPVRVTARLKDGTPQSFVGTYTLRRSVVDGATPEQRAWHIESADIKGG